MRRQPNLLADKPATPATARPAEPARPTNYVDLYGLAKPPFGGPVTGAGYILFNSHRRAFDLIQDHVFRGSGAVMLVGDEGIGKTEMLKAVAEIAASSGLQTIKLFRPQGRRLLRAEVLEAFGVGPEDDPVPAMLEPPRKIILVDDFDLLPAECLAELKTLMETPRGHIALVLTVSTTPRRPEINQLQDFATNTIRLIPLSPPEARQFIERSLWIAGGTTRRLIEPDAIRMIVARSGGMPGAISRMMEATLTAGFARGDAMITTRTVTAAIGRPTSTPRPAREPKSDAVAQRAFQIVAVLLFLAGASVFAYKALQPGPATQAPKAAPQPAQPQPPAASQANAKPALPPDLVAALISRGDQSLALGDITAARLFYQRAAEAGSAPAAVALGKTYDPTYTNGHGNSPDPAQAALWYKRAMDLGDPGAPDLMRKLGHG